MTRFTAILFCTGLGVAAENWPQFRGSGREGTVLRQAARRVRKRQGRPLESSGSIRSIVTKHLGRPYLFEER